MRKLMRTTGKRKIAKGMMALALSGVIITGGNTAKAASSVKGNLNGCDCYGCITIDGTSANATTTYGRGNSSIRATATVYYWHKNKYYKSSMTSSNSAGGAGATATKKIGGADVIGGKGRHRVSYDAYTWGTKTTTIGTIKEDAKEK